MDKAIYVRLDPNETVLERRPLVSYALIAIWILGALLLRLWPDPDLRPLFQSLKQLQDNSTAAIHPQFLHIAELFLDIEQLQQHPVEVQYDSQSQLLIEAQQIQLRGRIAMLDQAGYTFGLSRKYFTFSGLLLNPLFHLNVLVLLINLMLVYMIGTLLEDRWGRLFFAAFLVAAAILSSSFAMLLYTHDLPFFSGTAITAALLGAYCVRFYKTGLHFKTWFWSYGSGYVVVPSWTMLPVLIITPFASTLISIFLGVLPAHPGTIVTLLLFCFGIAVALVMKFAKLEPVFSGSDFDALASNEQVHTKVDRALFLGQTKDAFSFLRQGAKEHPHDLEIQDRLWQQAVRMNRGDEVLETGLMLMLAHHESGDLDSAFFIWQDWVKALPSDKPITRPIHHQLMNDLSLAGYDREADKIAMALALRNAPNLSLEEFHKLIASITPINKRAALLAIENRLAKVRKPADRMPLESMADQLRKNLPNDINQPDAPEAIEISPMPPPILDPNPPADNDPFRPTNIEHLAVLGLAKLRQDKDQLYLTSKVKQGEKRLPLDHIKAIYASKITPLSGENQLLLDLFLDDPMQEAKQHRCLRLRLAPYKPEHFDKLLAPLYQRTASNWPQYDRLSNPDQLESFPSEAEFAIESYGTVH